MAGETGPILPTLRISMTIAGLFGAACYICIEIFIHIVYTFKRYAGLYFWSMVVATTGIVLYLIANLFRLFAIAPSFPMSVLLVISWWAMVTGQSVVLYSRLHLVVRDGWKIRWVLIMIITNFFLLHIPVAAVFLACNLDPERFLLAFNIYERIQLVGFFLQESIISGLYIWEAGRGLKSILAVRGRGKENITRQLVIINTLVIFLDISVLITEYTGHLDIQTSYQPLVYALKLQMEFIILNKLINIVKQPPCNRVYPQSHHTLESLPGAHNEPWSSSADMGHPTKSYKSPKVVMESETNLTLEATDGGCHTSTSSAGRREPHDIEYGT
ncbi:uncharacterized protein PAC_12979 [Phialocephala subalpina]|uniref:DUF7703 domain-containing protein n=1 Tax=Phialocephala subalpina TaxID=576137 RepID=A0A1L7XDI9_9HELO|nr:uncharacterized protein PAC_12979 [Phialocephala subalpina]